MWFGLIQNQDASEFKWYVIHYDNCSFARREMELLAHSVWGRHGYSHVFNEDDAREMLDNFSQYDVPPKEKGMVKCFWHYKTPKEETSSPKLNPTDAFFKHIGDRLARDLMAVGDEPGHPAIRMEYKGLTGHGDEEQAQGGMCEDALASFFTRKLRSYLNS